MFFSVQATTFIFIKRKINKINGVNNGHLKTLKLHYTASINTSTTFKEERMLIAKI